MSLVDTGEPRGAQPSGVVVSSSPGCQAQAVCSL